MTELLSTEFRGVVAVQSPEPYKTYARDGVLSLFGGHGTCRSYCDGQWLVSDNALACLVTIGGASRCEFKGAGLFRWWTDRIDPALPKVDFLSFPTEAWGRTEPSRPIWLFVRRSDQPDYICVGSTQPAFVIGGRNDGWFHGDFELDQALSTALWRIFGRVIGDDTDEAEFDHLFGQLAPAADCEARFAMLKRLATYWHGPMPQRVRTAPSAFAMPETLRRWYHWAGPSCIILSGQNRLLEPADLRIIDGRLLFYLENQGCYLWATEPEGEDPMVYGRENDHQPWQPQDLSVSEHLVNACVFEALVCHAPYGGCTAWLDEAALRPIIERIPPMPIAPWRWPMTHTQFHAGNGAFAMITRDGAEGAGSLHIGARTQEALAFLKDLPAIDWDFASL